MTEPTPGNMTEPTPGNMTEPPVEYLMNTTSPLLVTSAVNGSEEITPPPLPPGDEDAAKGNDTTQQIALQNPDEGTTSFLEQSMEQQSLGITPPGEGEQTPPSTTGQEGEQPSGITPPGEGEDKSNKQIDQNGNEDPKRQEDGGNYCPKNDNGCDGIPDGPKPSWCSDLKGGCKNFIVCDENDCKYDKVYFPRTLMKRTIMETVAAKIMETVAAKIMESLSMRFSTNFSAPKKVLFNSIL